MTDLHIDTKLSEHSDIDTRTYITSDCDSVPSSPIEIESDTPPTHEGANETPTSPEKIEDTTPEKIEDTTHLAKIKDTQVMPPKLDISETKEANLPTKPNLSTTLRIMNHVVDFSVLTAIMGLHLNDTGRAALSYMRYPLFSGAAALNVVDTGFALHAGITNPNINTVSRAVLSSLLSPGIVIAVVGALAELPKFDVAAPIIFASTFGINGIYISMELAQAISKYNDAEKANDEKAMADAKQLIIDKSVGLASVMSLGFIIGGLMLYKNMAFAPYGVAISAGATGYGLYKLGNNLIDRYTGIEPKKENILVVVEDTAENAAEVKIEIDPIQNSEEDAGCISFIRDRLAYCFTGGLFARTKQDDEEKLMISKNVEHKRYGAV